MSKDKGLYGMLKTDSMPDHNFDSEGKCLRCHGDAESWEEGCVEEIIDSLRAELAEARAETAAWAHAVGHLRVADEEGFALGGPIAALYDLQASISPAAKVLLAAKQAMAELWGALCPDCGPEEYEYMMQDFTKRVKKADEYREVAVELLMVATYDPARPNPATLIVGWKQQIIDRARAVLAEKEGE